MELESRLHFKARLEREGRWRDVCLWMDNWRRDNVSKYTKAKVREMVWDEAEKQFPPIPISDQMAETWIPEDQMVHGHPDPIKDLLWVYRVFAVPSIQPKDAPNTGAWAMLCWARRNREKFFDHLMNKGCTNTAQKVVKEATNKSKKAEEPEKVEDRGLRRLRNIMEKTRKLKKKRVSEGKSGPQLNPGNLRGPTGANVPVLGESSDDSEGQRELSEEDS